MGTYIICEGDPVKVMLFIVCGKLERSTTDGGRIWLPLKVVFTSSARHFTDAAPIGNNRLGAMLWGGIDSERLQLNRNELFPWCPSPTPPTCVLDCSALVIFLMWVINS
jgi:hypothetical protein